MGKFSACDSSAISLNKSFWKKQKHIFFAKLANNCWLFYRNFAILPFKERVVFMKQKKNNQIS